MKSSQTLLWANLRAFLSGGENSPTTLSALTGRFPLSREGDKKVYRPSSRTGSVETAAREYIAISSTDLHNPFEDYLADDAKVWSMYLDLTKSKGEELMRIWNSDLDTILIFAGLFSAILTAFLIETRKNLQQDSQTITNNLLEQLIQSLTSEPERNSTLSPSQSTNFVPSSPLVWVNGLWFVSLTFSLTGAFGTILAKGWVSQFIPVSAGLPIVDACNRHRRFFGDDQRHLRAVIVALPITLHVAFYLFFGGLVILLFQDDPRIAVVVTALIAITMLLYLGCSVRPILNPNSPFRTPISGLLPIIPGILIPLILLGDAIGHLSFTPRKRRYKARRITGAYTSFERFCLSITKLRQLWMDGILHCITSLYQLMLVSNPPSDELRTDVLVGLFSLARSYNLDDPVCALAGLPITPRLQESLYATDPLPALTRNIAELFSSPTKTENPEVAQAYLTVLLSLVQTTHSSLNWTANSLMPLLERGGILSNWETFQGDILELIICIHVHVRVRSGFLLPIDISNRIPGVIANCTKPLRRQLLIQAALILSVMDKGQTLEGLATDERMHPMLLGPELGSSLSNMIRNPQKRVQRAVLSSISAIGAHESGCAALIHQDIAGLLLDHIPGSDSQFQGEALLIFGVFLRPETEDEALDENEDLIYRQDMLEPWIESIFSLFLAAMLKSEQLNVQEAAVTTLSSYLCHDYPREQFLRLDHTSALLSMLDTGESALQIAAMKVLSVVLAFDDGRSSIDLHECSRVIASAMARSTSQTGIHRHILEFVSECLAFDELKVILIPTIKRSLIELFKHRSSMSEFTDRLFSLLYDISRDNLICHHLLNADVILFLLNTITNTESFNPWSINITYQSLVNILHKNTGSLNFSSEIVNDIKKPLVSTDLIHTIIHLMERSEPSLQIRSMDLLMNCLHYFDLRQQLCNSQIIPHLIQRLTLTEPSVTNASLNTLMKLMEFDHIRPVILQPCGIIDSLLTIIKGDQTRLSERKWMELCEPSLKLLTLCLNHSQHPTAILPDSTPIILDEFLGTSNHDYRTVAALIIISGCAQWPHTKRENSAVVKFLSTKILEKVTDIFCSTNELLVQEKASDILYHIIHNDQLRPVIVMESFVQTLLHASVNSDITFQTSALELLFMLLKYEPTIPLSNPQYMDLLLANIGTCDYQAQTVIVNIVVQVAETADGRDTIIYRNVINKLMDLGTSPDTEVSATVIRAVEILFTYGEIRQEIDVTIFMQLITHILHTNKAQLHAAVCRTFTSFMKHRDVHHKVIHSEVIGEFYRSLYQSTHPLTWKSNLQSSQRYYFTRILQTMQEADSETLNILVQELLPPVTPFANQIAFEHELLEFPDIVMDSDRSEHSVIDDADSVILQFDGDEYYNVP